MSTTKTPIFDQLARELLAGDAADPTFPGWFVAEPTQPTDAHRQPDLVDTQPLDMIEIARADCQMCTDRGQAICHCRPGWTLPEDVVPDPVHGREQVPGGAT